MNIGIDALAFATPRAYLELTDLAAARNIPAEKLTKGIGAVRMAVARSYEDPVALAADAALRLFAHAGIDRSSIGYCAVGTETGIDHSKPIASYVHGLLGLLMSVVIPTGFGLVAWQISSQNGIRVSLKNTKERIDGWVSSCLAAASFFS